MIDRISTLLLAGGFLFATVLSANAQPQSDDQQRCIVALNGQILKITDKQRKVLKICLKDAVSGKLKNGQTAEECMTADSKGLVNRALAKTLKEDVKRCDEVEAPDFGYTGAANLGEVSVTQEIELFRDIYTGAGTLDAAVVPLSENRIAAKCQVLVAKAYGEILSVILRKFRRCKRDAMRAGNIISASDLEERCFQELSDDQGSGGGIERARSQFALLVTKRCFGIDLSTTFPGRCAAADSAAALAACVEQRAVCRACITLNDADGIDQFCDLFDNGLPDASCVDPGRCGNGELEPGELCDDGNSDDGDCCSSTCVPASVGQACDDGVFCNGADTCGVDGACGVHLGDPCLGGAECQSTCNEAAGNCIAEAGTACSSDGNECTDDVCDGLGSCTNTNNTAACDDGVFCNGPDTCSAGACVVHAGNPCAGGGECANLCNESAATCNLAAGTGCSSDGNPCTTDECNGGGVCTHPSNLAPCDDGVFCNGTDSCSGGACSVHSGDPCLGGGECSDACNEGTESCLDPDGAACTSDGNACTDNECDGSGNCVANNNSAPCDDGLFCNGADTCSGGACNQHAGDPCAGGAECADTCDESADTCNLDSGSACTDDGNACTDDVCNGSGSCVHPNNTDPCDDGLFCNGTDTCSGGACAVHSGNPCNGGAECADSCNEGADNCFDASGTACTDDGNPCTDDECNGAGGCSHPNRSGSCDDGFFCNGTDTCSSGVCQHSGDPCSGPDGDADCQESCLESADDCSAVDSNGTPCDDGDSCTWPDLCTAGVCGSTPRPGCGATVSSLTIDDTIAGVSSGNAFLDGSFDVHEWTRTVSIDSATGPTLGTVDAELKGALGADACCTVEDESLTVTANYQVAFDVVSDIDWRLDLTHSILGAFSIIDEKTALEDAGGRAGFETDVVASVVVAGGAPQLFSFTPSPTELVHAISGGEGTSDVEFSGTNSTFVLGNGNKSVLIDILFTMTAFSNSNAAFPAAGGDEVALRLGLADTITNGFTAGAYPSGNGGLGARDPDLDGHFLGLTLRGLPE